MVGPAPSWSGDRGRARHPRPCTYYTRYGHCKFGTNCFYLHVDSLKETEIENLKKDLNKILTLLNAKEKEMKALEEKVNQIEGKVKTFLCTTCESRNSTSSNLTTHTQDTQEEKPFICTQCDYTARTHTVLKRHYSMKHKVTDSWVFPTSSSTLPPIKCDESEECENSDKEFFCNQKFAMHYYTEHQYMFTCDHCHRNLPGPDIMYKLHI